MDRDDAIRKVRGLQAIASDERASPNEAAAAAGVARKLVEKYGIVDADLRPPEPEFEFFGMKLFFFNEQIQPHLDRIKVEIDAALATADQFDLQNRMDTYCRFYKDLRILVEGSTYMDKLKQRRDAAVKDYYQAESEAYRQRRKAWRDENPEDWEPIDQAYEDVTIHEHARDYTAIYSSLRKDSVERIVGIHETKLYLRAVQHHDCVLCGLDGLEARGLIGLFGNPNDDDKWKRDWMHVNCAIEAGIEIPKKKV